VLKCNRKIVKFHWFSGGGVYEEETIPRIYKVPHRRSRLFRKNGPYKIREYDPETQTRSKTSKGEDETLSEISKCQYIEGALKELAELLQLEIMELRVFLERGAINIIAKFDE